MRRHLLFLLPVLFLQGGVLLQAAPEPQFSLPKATLSLGTNTLTAQIAADDPARERGLMGRTSLGPDEGMVFVFPRARPVSFWMKDTPVPLSIAYIGPSGRILEIHELNPFDEHPVSSASVSVVYALEVPQGWFVRHGVMAGDGIGGLPSPAAAK